MFLSMASGGVSGSGSGYEYGCDPTGKRRQLLTKTKVSCFI